MLFRAGLRAGISGAAASCCCARLLAVRAISRYCDCVDESLELDFVEEEELPACSSASSFSSTMVEMCGLLTKDDARVAGRER